MKMKYLNKRISPENLDKDFPGILNRKNKDLMILLVDISRLIEDKDNRFDSDDSFYFAINKDLYAEVGLLKVFNFLGIKVKRKFKGEQI